MKAVILCAGKGERLRRLTASVPKPLLPVDGEPLLDRTIAWLKRHGITELFVNLHHLGNRIVEHLGDGASRGVRVTYSHEEALLGTAGALRAFAPHLNETFVLVYGDVVADVLDLADLLDFHRTRNGIATLVLQRTDRPHDSDVIERSKDGRIVGFHCTPGDFSHGDLGNAAVYVLESGILNYVPPSGVPDFVADVFPAALAAGEALYGYVTPTEVLDIGTPERYHASGRDAARRAT